VAGRPHRRRRTADRVPRSMPRKRLSTSCPRPVNSAVTKPLPLRNRPMTAAVDPADPSPGVGSTIMNRRSLCRKRPRSPRARDHADHHRVLRPCWAGRHPETGMIVHDQQSGTHHRISCLPDRPASVLTLTKGAPDLGTVRASPSGCAPRRVPGSAGAPRFDPPPECLASPLSAADQRTGDKTMDTDPAGTPMKPTARQRQPPSAQWPARRKVSAAARTPRFRTPRRLLVS
jgi:hypothetical protein